MRITDISVRSALMRVRCIARPVFREANSNEIELWFDFDVMRSSLMTTSLLQAAWTQPHRTLSVAALLIHKRVMREIGPRRSAYGNVSVSATITDAAG